MKKISYKNMTIEEFLLHHTNVGDVIVFRNSGWYEGITIIDSEDLFIRLFDETFLNYEIKEVKHNQSFSIIQTEITVTEVNY